MSRLPCCLPMRALSSGWTSLVTSCVLLLWLRALPLVPVRAQQDYQLYGMFDSYLNPITDRSRNVITSRCFYGLGLINCRPTLPDDDVSLAYELPYLETLVTLKDSAYCLQCCGSSPDYTDTWDLSCPVYYGTGSAVNLYGYELRMARRRTTTDSTIITCPLRRSACTYSDTGKTLSCNRASDKTFLVGYQLTLRVIKWDKDFSFWRGVESCEIETIESNTSLSLGDTFYERIILEHAPLQYPTYDMSKILIILLLIVVVIYGLLYFCRRKHCPYCQKKLVLAYNLCFTCIAVGAKMPDPVLLKALEHKGELVQGTIPERFPGSRVCVASVRALLLSCWTIIVGWFWKTRTVKVHPVLVYKSNLDLIGLDPDSRPNRLKRTSADGEPLSPSKLDEESKVELELEETLDETDRVLEQNANASKTVANKDAAGTLEKTSSLTMLSNLFSNKKSKYARLREKWEKQRTEAMKENPNVLNYTPELIFQAIDHPKFLEFKPQPQTQSKKAKRPADRYEFP